MAKSESKGKTSSRKGQGGQTGNDDVAKTGAAMSSSGAAAWT